MEEPRFQPDQLVRILSAPGYRESDDTTRLYGHFVEKDSIVKIIKFEEHRGELRGYYIYGAPACFKSHEKGQARYGYKQGVQFILENELEFVGREIPKFIKNPAQLPEI